MSLSIRARTFLKSPLCFVPALDEFLGDPMGALSAAVIFCVERDIDPGEMRMFARELK